MTDHTYLNNANPEFIDSLYKQFINDPNSVDEKWRQFFEGFELGIESNKQPHQLTDKEVNVIKLIHAYRSRGHLISKTNPIRQRRIHKSDLELGYFNLSENDFAT